MAVKPARAKALSVEDRQAMLIDAVTPLLLEHGQAWINTRLQDVRLTIEDVVKRRGDPSAHKAAAPAVPAKPASGRQAAAKRAATEVINP